MKKIYSLYLKSLLFGLSIFPEISKEAKLNVEEMKSEGGTSLCWKRLKELVDFNQIEWHWIKSHSNNPMNELADRLAKKATPV